MPSDWAAHPLFFVQAQSAQEKNGLEMPLLGARYSFIALAAPSMQI
jgi:hypothetical protein